MVTFFDHMKNLPSHRTEWRSVYFHTQTPHYNHSQGSTLFTLNQAAPSERCSTVSSLNSLSAKQNQKCWTVHIMTLTSMCFPGVTCWSKHVPADCLQSYGCCSDVFWLRSRPNKHPESYVFFLFFFVFFRLTVAAFCFNRSWKSYTSSCLSTVVWSCYVALCVEVWNISLLFDEWTNYLSVCLNTIRLTHCDPQRRQTVLPLCICYFHTGGHDSHQPVNVSVVWRFVLVSHIYSYF